jgi:hypothetical protein
MRKWSFGGVVVRMSIAVVVLCGLIQYIDGHRERVASKNQWGVAVMPAEKVEVQVRDLKPYQAGWVVPWAIAVSEEGTCWINPKSVVWPDKLGTARVYVTVNERQGIMVRSYDREFRWDRVPSSELNGYMAIWSFTY